MSVTPSLVATAQELLTQATRLAQDLEKRAICSPSLEVGSSTELWTIHEGEIEDTRAAILKLTQRLEKLVLGPNGFLHEYVSANWEYGALYVLVDHDVFEAIPISGPPISIDILSELTGLPSEKLLRICRLVACCGILQEPLEGFFGHTVISETLVSDPGFKSFIGFQLFETRVASAALSGSFRRPNPYWTGQPSFDLAWGMSMYEWHAKHEKCGRRFAEAMNCVSAGLDPGNGMIIKFLRGCPDINGEQGILLVEVGGKTGNFSRQLAAKFPSLRCEVQDDSETLLQRGQATLPPELADRITFHKHALLSNQTALRGKVTGSEQEGNRVGVFLLRSTLWSLPDEACVKLLQTFVSALRYCPHDGGKPAVLVISDLVSPKYGTFEPHVERAYRRRDVTLMTMHNAMQRTSAEWMRIIQKALPDFKISYSETASSHSCRGLWSVQLP